MKQTLQSLIFGSIAVLASACTVHHHHLPSVASAAKRPLKDPTVLKQKTVRSTPIDPRAQEKTARHEFGHAVARAYLMGSAMVHSIEVSAVRIPRKLLGMSHPNMPLLQMTADQIRRDVADSYAGRMVDELLYGAPDAGATHDISYATGAIWEMYLKNGLGGVVQSLERNEAPEWMVAAVKKELEDADHCGRAVVAANIDVIRELADFLLDEPVSDGKRIVSGAEFRAFLVDRPLQDPVSLTDEALPAYCSPSVVEPRPDGSHID